MGKQKRKKTAQEPSVRVNSINWQTRALDLYRACLISLAALGTSSPESDRRRG